MKKTLLIIGLLVLTLFSTLLFLLIGISIGGNYFTDFEFLGGRGYEAMGNLGMFVGLILGLSASYFIYRKVGK